MRKNDNYIQVIAEVKSISIAADIIGISQPGLSAYLKKKEQALGTVLFDRSHMPLELTPAGKLYLEYLEREEALSRELIQNINDIENLKTGKLTVGGASFFNVAYLPRTVANFCKKYPGVEIEILDGKVPELTTAAQKGTLDLFFTPIAEGDNLFNFEKLLDEKVFIAVPDCWEVNESLAPKEIPLKKIISGELDEILELSGEEFRSLCKGTFVTLKKDQDIGRKLQSLLTKYSGNPASCLTAEQTMTTLALTQAGVGVSLITESSIKTSMRLKNTPKLYFLDKEICNRQIFVAYPKNKYLSNGAKEFISMLKENNK